MLDYYHDTRGNLQPAEIHEITPEKLRQRHVDAFPNSVKRAAIHAGWQRYIAEFTSEVSPVFKQWIGGSFATKKEDPGDIDVVNFVPHEEYTSAVNRFDASNGSKDKFMVDGRSLPVYPEGNPGYELSRFQKAHWLKFFTHDRQGNETGILSVEIEDVTP